MKSRKKTAALALAALTLTLAVSGCGKVKVGYVDESRLVQEAPQIKSLVDEGNAKINEEIQNAQKAQQANPNMSQEDAQKAQMESQRKIQSLNQSYSLQMQQKADVAYREVLTEKKLDVLLKSDKNEPTSFYGSTDVTDDVIQKLQ